ncbi:hypothetical protein J6590_094799 [Homalodisca vitripennis]|nr:hypothetical protein J6590_094799 [Homalodisca vitripennis]
MDMLGFRLTLISKMIASPVTNRIQTPALRAPDGEVRRRPLLTHKLSQREGPARTYLELVRRRRKQENHIETHCYVTHRWVTTSFAAVMTHRCDHVKSFTNGPVTHRWVTLS